MKTIALSLPAPATTGADVFVHAVAAKSLVRPETIAAVAWAIDQIAGGLRVIGIAALADVPGALRHEREAVRAIASAMGVEQARESAERIISGEAEGIDHVWQPWRVAGATQVPWLWRCSLCALETSRTSNHERGCPSAAIRAALRARKQEART